MKEGVDHFSPAYLFDEGSTISWIPCGRKLSCSYFGNEVSILEMDGQFDRLDELIYVESHLSNLSTKFYGEVTLQMLKHADFPGSNNGTKPLPNHCRIEDKRSLRANYLQQNCSSTRSNQSLRLHTLD
ncbi:Detected protein of unknown function [Hibiscus syriacus]|uniref:Uncharacterized protein n=1 Tax=Hibiscus syriacus TaxID=106335 RepID=A0A6A3BJ03_HIBSY|nr:Detected protein of unknown function [Hibiscus syriacus]